MKEKLEIKVLMSNQRVCNAFITVTTTPTCEIEFHAKNYDMKKFVGLDLFEAAMQLRKWLEVKGNFALCNFSRKNIQPSGMSRQMSFGRKAYLVNSEDVLSTVDIFASCDINQISKFRARKLFIGQWAKSEK